MVCVGGCVDVLMVQSAEKLRLSKWEELPLPVGAFLYLSIFSVGILCVSYFCILYILILLIKMGGAPALLPVDAFLHFSIFCVSISYICIFVFQIFRFL